MKESKYPRDHGDFIIGIVPPWLLELPHRSGLGLLFLIKGEMNGEQRLVISRFPADQGVIAEEQQEQLSVEFVERVFMKSAKAYKSAIYSSDAPERGFWDGRAVDLQITGPPRIV